MPTPKISLNLLVCASLAVSAGWVCAQTASGSGSPTAPAAQQSSASAQQTPAQQTPAQQTPAQQTPAQQTPAQQTPAQQAPSQQTPGGTAQDQSAASGNASTSSADNCSGPVLHRAPDKGGDICATPAPASPSSGDDENAADNGKNSKLTDPNVNPFPQAEPDKNGMMPGVHAGSIENVNAVGTRNIGARGMGNWYSTESEIKMGKQYADEIEKSTKFINDPVVTEYVNRIGQNIVKNSDCKVPFTIKVIDTDEINAMALPGGFFYVNSGLILAADEEAELAGVMAHETAHVCAHHAAREMTRANYAQIGMVPLIMMTGYSWTGYGIYEATQLADPHHFP